MAAGADELRSLPPECVRLIIEAGSESKLLDTPGRLRKADLLAFARVNSMWQGCAMEELVRHLYLEQWNPQFEDWMGDSLPSRVETLTLGRNADLDSSEQRGWLGEQVDAVTRLCGAKLKEVTISGSDDLSIENLACLQKLEALHLNLAGHYKMKDYARAANITSSFANLHRLSLVDVPLLDIAAIFAAGDSFPSLRHLVLVRPQLAHPMHPFERAPSGSRIGPQLTALVVGQNWQHALGSRSLAEFTALESFSIIGSAGMDAGGFRPIEVIKAPLRRLTLAHAMAEDGFLASLRKNPISVSRLEKCVLTETLSSVR
ncbi:hypothetical protein RQP46_002995 [Phenoliferia psychrophenolica]